jgi:hypothetical protein
MTDEQTVVRPPLVVKDVVGMFLTFAEWHGRVAAEWAHKNWDRPSSLGVNAPTLAYAAFNAALGSVELIQIATWLRAHPNKCARLQAAFDRADRRQLASLLGPVLLDVPLNLPLVQASPRAISTACRAAVKKMVKKLEAGTRPNGHPGGKGGPETSNASEQADL